jgi:hypothetical protein
LEEPRNPLDRKTGVKSKISMMQKPHKRIIFILLAVTAIATSISLVNPGNTPWIGFLTAGILGYASIFSLQWALRRFNAEKTIRVAVYLAFALRLIIGILLFVLLPSFGYDEPYNNNGYLYLDAFRRDTDAWQLATSEAPITAAFQAEFSTDQYGGLLGLSALIYRLFSPDAHRPLLILILTSFFSALGIPFLWHAIRQRWDDKTAVISAWILALYPESVILGASQMREPILIGLSAIAFWGVTIWKDSKKQSLLAILISLMTITFISTKAAAAVFAAIAVWFWFDNLFNTVKKRTQILSWVAIACLLALVVFLSWSWLIDSSRWDISLMESASGRIQWELELLGDSFQAPFIITYGLAQPVLPAAIIYPGIPLTRSVAIFRALGWYLLVPVMLAGFIMLWHKDNKKDRRVLFLFFLIVIIWTVISSARAGGDQWDNPRYRSIFLAWMALIAGWGWVQTLQKKSLWLWRLLLLEAIYIGYFIQWYLSRYYGIFKRMDFLPMIRLLFIIGAVITGGGIIFDWVISRYKMKSKLE